jgi:hypothetical protein
MRTTPSRRISLSLIATMMLLLSVTVPAQPDNTTRLGKAVYNKANCVGCHKWHGGGGGGYGGVALSLRETKLDANSLSLVVRCGRPATGMPYHDRKAYVGENRDCYNVTKTELGDSIPARAHYFLKDAEVDAVVEYVIQHVQGKGVPDHADCVAFWGQDARRCQNMAQ